jgi:schlafen family protein
MTLGSFVHGALADLTLEDLERMLGLDETLFVEHKSGIGADSAYKLMQAVAAFANTLGGWLLIGVHNGKPMGGDAAWARSGDAPTLVDVVRDRLRGEIDPLPAFEAKVMAHPDGPVGVIRVYESSDTPHVALRSGSVFVREVAGVADASDSGKPGARAHGQRVYRATQIRSRAQLLELAARGRLAGDRVAGLVDPTRPLPLINDGLGLVFERVGEDRVQPRPIGRGVVFVRVVPYTLVPRFRAWATTAEASSAVLAAAEGLAQRRGLDNSWKIPDPSGAAIQVPLEPGARHRDALQGGLDALARVVVDGGGLAGAALELAGPDDARRRAWIQLDELARDLIVPTARAAADVLQAGEMLGRAWCQIDLVGLSTAMLIEGGGNREPRYWVPTGADLTLPVDDEQIDALALRAAYAFARGAGIPAWDPPSRA